MGLTRLSYGGPSDVDNAHRENGKRVVVYANEKLTAFIELKRVTRESLRFLNVE